MPGSFETVHDPVKQQKRRTRAFEEEMRKRREQEKEDMMASLEPPEKEEVTPEPPGPRDTWPCAFIDSGQCEDVCGNQHVLKYRQAPGVAEIGRPPAGAVVKVAYSAHTAGSDVRQWDASESLGFRLGQLWVNRLLDAAAASLEWGERATFVCTRAYAELNNASRHPLPTPAEEHACFRYEVELLSWKPPQLRDTTSAYDTTAEQRIDEVGRLKGAAAPLVQHGYVASARELYADAIGYLENREGRTDGACFVAPEGREVEAHALLASLYLNDAMCTLKLNDDLPRAEALATRALELPAGSLTNAMEVKARFRRGVARTRMHDYAEASADLHAAAKLDPKSRDVREALAELSASRAAATKRDATFAGRGLGSKAGAIARAPPGGGLKKPATVWLDVSVGDAPPLRLTLQMFEGAPLTIENFRCLCTGERGVGQSGAKLHFKGCEFHRLIPGYILQGGDVVYGTGKGGDSIYGFRFRDERFLRKHDRAGLVAMANVGPDTNSSQFYLTLCAAPHLDGTSAVFGEVTEGLAALVELLREVEVDARDQPKQAVTIVDCGEVELDAHGASQPKQVATTVVDCGAKTRDVDGAHVGGSEAEAVVAAA